MPIKGKRGAIWWRAFASPLHISSSFAPLVHHNDIEGLDLKLSYAFGGDMSGRTTPSANSGEGDSAAVKDIMCGGASLAAGTLAIGEGKGKWSIFTTT